MANPYSIVQRQTVPFWLKNPRQSPQSQVTQVIGLRQQRLLAAWPPPPLHGRAATSGMACVPKTYWWGEIIGGMPTFRHSKHLYVATGAKHDYIIYHIISYIYVTSSNHFLDVYGNGGLAKSVPPVPEHTIFTVMLLERDYLEKIHGKWNANT